MDEADRLQERMLAAARGERSGQSDGLRRLESRLQSSAGGPDLGHEAPERDQTEAAMDRLLAAGRADRIPRPDHFDRLGDAIVARCEEADATAPRRARAWLVGGLVAVAAMLLVLLGVRIATEGEAAAPESAEYGARPQDSGGSAQTKPPIATRARNSNSGEPFPEGRNLETEEPAPSATGHSGDSHIPTSPSPEVHPKSPRRRSPAGAGTFLPKADRAKGPPREEPAAVQAPTSDVAGESSALRVVQRALAADDLERARTALTAYRRRFPSGVLAPEADGLAAIVRCRRGVANAAAIGQRFAKAHPTSPLGARVAAACSRPSRKKTDKAQTETDPSRHPRP